MYIISYNVIRRRPRSSNDQKLIVKKTMSMGKKNVELLIVDFMTKRTFINDDIVINLNDLPEYIIKF